MKIKILTSVLAIGLLTAGAANARVDLSVNLGAPAPVYVAPAPVYAPPPPVAYVQPYGYGYINHPYVHNWDPHHRASDYRYWHDRHDHR